MQSTSFQLKAYLTELGPGAKFKASELRQRMGVAASGGISGFLCRAEKMDCIRLIGNVPSGLKNGKPDRMFEIMPGITTMPVQETAPTNKGGHTRTEGGRSKTNFGKAIMTREQVRDKLLELATYFDTNPLTQYTEQELIAELGRRYEGKK